MALIKKLFIVFLGISLLQTGAFAHMKCSPHKDKAQGISSKKTCAHQKAKNQKRPSRSNKVCKANCCDFLANLPTLTDKDIVNSKSRIKPNYHYLVQSLNDYLFILRRPPKKLS